MPCLCIQAMDRAALLMVLAMMVVTAGESAVPFSGTVATILHLVLLLALGIALVFVVAPIRHPVTWNTSTLDRLFGHPRALEAVVFVAAVAAAQLSGWLVASSTNDPSLQPGSGRIPNTATAVLQLLVLAPLVEELVFRGWLLRQLQRRMGPRVGVAVSAIAFGAIHSWPAGAAANMIFGLFLGWLAMRTRTLWPCIAAHAASNTIGLIWLHVR